MTPKPPTHETAFDEATRETADLIGEQIGRHLGRLYNLMDDAEDEISTAMVRHPEQARLLWNSFQFLAPGVLDKYDSRLFCSHCCEILERIAQAGKFVFLTKTARKERPLAINRPTAAECLIGVSEASYVAPMHGAGSLAFHLLFHKVYGHDSPWPIEITHDDGGRISMNVIHPNVTIRMHEQWTDQTEDLIAEARWFLFRRGLTSYRDQSKDRALPDGQDFWTPPQPKASSLQLKLFAA